MTVLPLLLVDTDVAEAEESRPDRSVFVLTRACSFQVVCCAGAGFSLLWLGNSIIGESRLLAATAG